MLWATQGSPVIFLPRALVVRLTAEETRTLLAHELAHYRRRDHWVRWLEVLVLGVYWWNPVAWIARQGLQRSEEECCDAWVLSVLPNAAAVYARTILKTVEFLTADCRPSPALASGLGPVHVLERRFEMILHTRPSHRVGVLARCALMMLALVVLPLSARGQRPAVPDSSDAVSNLEKPKEALLPEVPQANSDAPANVAESKGAPAPGDTRIPSDLPPVKSDVPANMADGRYPKIPAGSRLVASSQPGANDTEHRLERLEKMVQSLVAEVQGQQHWHRYVNLTTPKSTIGTASAAGAGTMAAQPSLSDLKKHRIDLEDELERIKDEMEKVDGQIAKLQSARSPKHGANEAIPQ
jgi:hypothetical protein